MSKSHNKLDNDLKKQSLKGLLSLAGVADNERLSKTNSDTPNRYSLAIFMPEICPATQTGHNESINTSYPFTRVNRHILDMLIFQRISSYVRKTSQNSPFWVICGADTVSSESDSEHPISFHSVLLTQNLTGGYHA